MPWNSVWKGRAIMATRRKLSAHWRGAQVLLPLAFLLLAVALPAGRALAGNGNWPVSDALTKAVHPTSPLARAVWFPVSIPVRTVALALDATVVHPITAIPLSGKDAKKFFRLPASARPWKKTLVTVPVTALTPVVFVGDWVRHVLLPIGKH
jgi:hypothetical protein